MCLHWKSYVLELCFTKQKFNRRSRKFVQHPSKLRIILLLRFVACWLKIFTTFYPFYITLFYFYLFYSPIKFALGLLMISLIQAQLFCFRLKCHQTFAKNVAAPTWTSTLPKGKWCAQCVERWMRPLLLSVTQPTRTMDMEEPPWSAPLSQQTLQELEDSEKVLTSSKSHHLSNMLILPQRFQRLSPWYQP